MRASGGRLTGKKAIYSQTRSQPRASRYPETLRMSTTQPTADIPLSLPPLITFLRADWWLILMGALLCFFGASVLMTGWPAGLQPNISFPYAYTGDAVSSNWLTQRAIEGWIFDNDRSGFPFGSSFLDYPGADSGNFLILKLLGLLTGSSAGAMNLFYLLGFSANFATAYLVLRSLSSGRAMAFAFALLFTLAPFHFIRLGHIFYTWYFAIPLYFYVALCTVQGGGAIDFLKLSRARQVMLAVGYLVLACFGVYYTFFGMIVIGTGAMIALLRGNVRNVARIAAPALLLLSIGTFANLAPNLLNSHQEGANPEVAVRAPMESEVYGVKLMQFVVPRPGHRSEWMRKVADHYNSSTPLINENTTAALGFFGGIGLFALGLVALARMAGVRTDERLTLLATTTAMLLAFMVIGGLGSLFAHLVSPSIRGWNRASVFVSFSSVAVLAVLLQRFADRFSKRHGLSLASTIAAVILMLGTLDQTTPACRECAAETQRVFEQDKSFIEGIEATLPEGAAVYQLPYMPFPEVAPLHGLHTYELAVGFLHSKALKWSYAGMKGREGDLVFRALSERPAGDQLQEIAKLGFKAIYLDKRGFADHGEAAVAEWTEATGGAPHMTRDDGNVVLFVVPEALQKAYDPSRGSPD